MIVGWQEDFNLGWKDVVPAQTDALSYMMEAAGAFRGSIRTGGHSKGGNLTIYAAANVTSTAGSMILSWNRSASSWKRCLAF